MNLDFSFFISLINFVGFLANVSTVIYILKNFDITVHVFALLFIDSLISTSCSFMATVIRGFVISNIFNWGFSNCTVLFLSTFLPTHFGGILTCLVAAIRLILTKKSAQNIQVSNSKVFILSFSTFLLFVALYGAYYAFNLMLDIPFVIVVEVCSSKSRPVGTMNNMISIVLDILMIRFIRETVLPDSVQNNHLQNHIFLLVQTWFFSSSNKVHTFFLATTIRWNSSCRHKPLWIDALHKDPHIFQCGTPNTPCIFLA